jgi:hypothetical protein
MIRGARLPDVSAVGQAIPAAAPPTGPACHASAARSVLRLGLWVATGALTTSCSSTPTRAAVRTLNEGGIKCRARLTLMLDEAERAKKRTSRWLLAARNRVWSSVRLYTLFTFSTPDHTHLISAREAEPPEEVDFYERVYG